MRSSVLDMQRFKLNHEVVHGGSRVVQTGSEVVQGGSRPVHGDSRVVQAGSGAGSAESKSVFYDQNTLNQGVNHSRRRGPGADRQERVACYFL